MIKFKKGTSFTKFIEKNYGKDFGANNTEEITKLLIDRGFKSLANLINGTSKDFYRTATR